MLSRDLCWRNGWSRWLIYLGCIEYSRGARILCVGMDILVGDALMVRGFGLGFLEWTICGFARGYVMDFLMDVVGDYFRSQVA